MAAFKLGDGTACRVPSALAAGRTGRIALGVRPEKIRLTEPDKEIPAGHNRLTGTIAHASYLGVSTQYIVQLPDGHRVTVFEQNVTRASKSELWATGESVVLSWQPDHSFIVEDAGGVGDDDALGTDALQPVAAA
jgi:spermidine/putrescine transport system ATP-binding protein